MDLTYYTPDGAVTHQATTQELIDMAKNGNIQAIRELIALKGGWDALTATQKEKVTQLILGFGVAL